MGQNVSKGVEKVMGPRVDVVLDPKDVLVERRGIVWNVDGTIRSCVFCDIASGEIREHPEHLTKVVYEDNLVVAFAPLKIAAKQHFLVIPRQHITHVGDLFANDITVMDRMRAVGTELLKKGNADVTPENIRFCFHVPPWNSIGECIIWRSNCQNVHVLQRYGRNARGLCLRKIATVQKGIPHIVSVHSRTFSSFVLPSAECTGQHSSRLQCCAVRCGAVYIRSTSASFVLDSPLQTRGLGACVCRRGNCLVLRQN